MSRDRRVEERTVHLGRELVIRFVALLRSLRLYGPGNEAVRQLGSEITGLVGEILEGGVDLDVSVKQDSIFVAGVRVREGAVASSSYHRFIDILRTTKVASFRVDEEATPADVEHLARLVAEAAEGRRTPEELRNELAMRTSRRIEVKLGDAEEELPEDLDAERVARRIYLNSIGVIKSVFHEVRSQDRISARRVKRVVQEMIESLDANPGYLMNLTSLKNYDEYTFNHSANVSVLAIAFGKHVGLARKQLYQLGQAGMLHDLGKICLAKELLNKPGRLTPVERARLEQHAVDGFLEITGRLGVSDGTIGVALGAYEHHVNEDGSGYPHFATARRKQLLSRLVSIVDRYDAMTSARVYRSNPIPPPKTLAIMYHQQGSHHDRVLLRFFMNLVGFYPLGTAVRLSDGAVGVVVGGADHAELRHFPTVQLLLDPDGSPASGTVLDLAATAKEREPIRVEEVLDAAQYGVEVMDYLL